MMTSAQRPVGDISPMKPLKNSIQNAEKDCMEKSHCTVSKTTLLVILSLAVTGCVSVSLKSEPLVKSSTLAVEAPQAPFQEMKSSQGFDSTFRNPKTNSTIAVLSECSSKQRLGLDAVESDFAGILNTRERKSSEKNRFGINPSQFSVFAGEMDGKDLVLALFVTRKQDCVYSFSLIADPKHFQSDLTSFESLIQNSKW